MRSFSIFLCFLISHSARCQLHSLFDVLKTNANASKFAQAIQENPNLSAVFLSPSTRTVFAPSDDALEKLSSQNPHPLVFRQSGDAAAGSYQACLTDESLGQIGANPGAVLNQQPAAPPPGGTSTSISTSTSDTESRKVVSKPPEPPNANLTKRATHQDHNRTQNPIQIFSGLGNIVNITKGDIPYDGGRIHVVDGYFTIPQTFSETSNAKNHTAFAGLTNKANLTSLLDSTPEITIFIPTNNAIQGLQGNVTESPSALTALLSNHIINGFAGYLPLLVDGASYQTAAGTNISVSIQNGEYFINGVRIVAPNLIIPNGVAHVINQVLTPTKSPAPPPRTFTSAGWSCLPTRSSSIFWLVLATAAVTLPSLF